MKSKSKKILAASIALVVFCFAVYAVYFTKVVNPRIAEELRAEPQGERAAKVMLLHFPNGRSLPVNYLHEGNTVFAGADFGWWRAFEGDGIPVRVLIKGELLSGHGRVILDDPVYRDKVFSRLRPSVPPWIPEWGKAKLVQITLTN